jgi:hypothetical protein
MDIPLSEVISAGGGIIATSFGASRLFFSRLAKIEDKFASAIDKLTTTVSELDKRLAVNSCIIDKFMEQGDSHGFSWHRRNKKTDRSD